MKKMSVLAGIGLAMAIAGFVYGVVAVGGVVMVVGIIGMAVAAAGPRATGLIGQEQRPRVAGFLTYHGGYEESAPARVCDLQERPHRPCAVGLHRRP